MHVRGVQGKYPYQCRVGKNPYLKNFEPQQILFPFKRMPGHVDNMIHVQITYFFSPDIRIRDIFFFVFFAKQSLTCDMNAV